jgi:exodeoxyribonuclease III
MAKKADDEAARPARKRTARAEAPGAAPRRKSLTLLSWNVNGVRAAGKKGFGEWLAGASPDVLCLQETKARPEQIPPPLRDPAGYRSFWNPAERPGYSGTAVFSRVEPVSVERALGADEFDHEGRVVVARFDSFSLVDVYVPNGRSDLSRVPFKLAFSDALLGLAERLRREGRGVILCGDFNTAHEPIDLAHPKENEKNTGFLPEERSWLDKFTGMGYVDTFRHFFPDKEGAYTWWDLRTRARPRNVGWRLDYFFATVDLLPRLKSAFILPDVMGSDHCPVGIELEACE